MVTQGKDAAFLEIAGAIRKYGSGNAAARALSGRYTRYQVQAVAKQVRAANEDLVENDVLESRRSKEVSLLNRKYRDAVEKIGVLQSQLDVLASFPVPKARVVEPEESRPEGDAAAVVAWGDWHLEERIDPDTVDGMNVYDPDVFRRRHHAMLQNTVKLIASCRSVSNVDELVISLLGDFFSGYIHPELKAVNAMGPMEALAEARDKIIEGIEFLAANAGVPRDRIRVVACYGNHSRITEKSWHSRAASVSLEYMMYVDLATRYQGDIHWDIAKGAYKVVDIKGKAVRFHHGDRIRYYGGVGGIGIPLNKTIAAWNKVREADFDVLGHFHQYKYDKGGRWMTCPTLAGYSAFAVDIKADYEEPAQGLLIVDRRHRTPVFTYDVFCE